ncbi:ATP-binding protein [Streptomyces sp. N35]|uniref:ATP-binding protein n=1 Tax=Streptomyces sp. N35 TaxID=2795730 RepID=UPI0018F4E51B|nr:ATP-binding protein [Streptomyces sp. N35]
MVSRPGLSAAGRSLLWLTVVVLISGGVGAAAVGAGAGSQRSLTVGLATLGGLLLVWGLLTVRRLASAQAERERLLRMTTARDAEVGHLAAVRMPAIVERVNAGQRLDGVAGPLRSSAELGEDFARALDTVAAALSSDEAVRRERALRDSVQAAFESVARTMHAMATVQQQVLDQIERDIVDPHLMARVMKADHAAAQMTRKAQTLLVMCGVWPARRETQPVSLYDCVRGAMSRIVEFGRVEVHGGQTLYAAPPAVEGLMHALAELLENATVFSPSPSKVIVSVREVGAGAVIEVDDAGHGMPPDVLEQATAQLTDDLDLARLGAVPRLGLACVGRWMRELGFDVQLSGTSAYGGTRAVAFVPYRLLTEPLSNLANPARPAVAQSAVPQQRTGAYDPVPAQQQPASGGEGPEVGGLQPTGAASASSSDATAAGLPQRRSRRTATGSPARHAAPPPAPAAPAEPWTPEAARASIASVVSGTLRGRAPATAYDETGDSGQHPAHSRPAPTADEPPFPSTMDTPDGGQP